MAIDMAGGGREPSACVSNANIQKEDELKKSPFDFLSAVNAPLPSMSAPDLNKKALPADGRRLQRWQLYSF